MGDKCGHMATVKLIAERLNVSPATVSRGLRGGRGVRAETLERILLAAEDMGYSKSSSADTTVRSIAMVVTTQPDGELFELARRYMLVVNQEFSKRGWHLHPVMIPGLGDQGEVILSNFIQKAKSNGVKMDACLMVGTLPNDLPERFHRQLAERFEGRVVMICRHDILNGLSGVTLMDYMGGQQASQILLRAGHQCIGWIGSLGSESNADERLSGVLKVFRKSEARVTQQIWLNDLDPLPISEVGKALKQQLPDDRKSWPTAWVCSTDWLAAKLIVWARMEGLRVPEDMSVVAFDNTKNAEELAEMVITSIIFPYEQVARNSVELLERQINAPEAKPIIWSLPPEVRSGETVSRLRNDNE